MTPAPGRLTCPCCGEPVDLFGGGHWADVVALRDPQTGAANLPLVCEIGEHSLALARRYGRFVAALRLRLGGLREATSGLDERAATRLVAATCARMRESIRESDLIARLATDEFLIVLTELWEPEGSARVAHRIMDSFGRSVRSGLRSCRLSARIGAALFPDDGATLEELNEKAGAALARLGSDPGVEYFDRDLGPATLRALRLEADLKRGLAGQDFRLEYQPIIGASSNTVVGAEALARWDHVTEGPLRAEQFIPLAERSGRVRTIDRWAIETATAQARRWLDGGWRGWIAVNVSGRSLQDRRLAEHLARALKRWSLPERSLVLEITETAALLNPTETAQTLRELNDLGVYVALDDFGAGYSSFRYMQDAPIDIVKIDRSFVQLRPEQAPQARLLEGLILVAHHLGKPVVAEGVEEERHREWLQDVGCDLLQGYLLGRPMPADIFEDRFVARAAPPGPHADAPPAGREVTN